MDENKKQQQSRFARMALYVETLPPAQRARLRHFRKATPPAVFWALAERFRIRPDEEEDWEHMVRLMVLHPHREGARPGRVLARAGVAPKRFERWLRLSREKALEEASALLRLTHGEALDWDRFGWLLTRWDDEQKRRIAREFFVNTGR